MIRVSLCLLCLLLALPAYAQTSRPSDAAPSGEGPGVLRSLRLPDGPYVARLLLEKRGDFAIVVDFQNSGGRRDRRRVLRYDLTGASDPVVLVEWRGVTPGGRPVSIAWGASEDEVIVSWKQEILLVTATSGKVLNRWRTEHPTEWALSVLSGGDTVYVGTSLERVLVFSRSAEKARSLCSWGDKPLAPSDLDADEWYFRHRISSLWKPTPDRLVIGTQREFQLRSLPSGALVKTIRLSKPGSEALVFDGAARRIYATTNYTPGHTSATHCYGVFRYSLDDGSALPKLSWKGQLANNRGAHLGGILPGGRLLLMPIREQAYYLLSPATGKIRRLPAPPPSVVLERRVWSADRKLMLLLSAQVITSSSEPPRMRALRLTVTTWAE